MPRHSRYILRPPTDVDQAARAAGFRSRSDHHLKEVNKSYNKEKTHARKEIMISIAMYIRRSTHSIPAHKHYHRELIRSRYLS